MVKHTSDSDGIAKASENKQSFFAYRTKSESHSLMDIAFIYTVIKSETGTLIEPH
jgi:hypothetical protein